MGGEGGELTSAWKWGGSTDPFVSPFLTENSRGGGALSLREHFSTQPTN